VSRIPGLLALALAAVLMSGTPSPAATGSQATPIAASSAAGVPVSLTIENHGATADRLLGGSSPVADRVEVHATRLIAGKRVMTTLDDGSAIPAATTLTLEPGAQHLMLIGLRIRLVQGETFPLTLSFQRAGEVTVTGRVRRKVDAAGVPPIPTACAGDLCVALVSAPPAPAVIPPSS
jgi:copper(I)-binding protein